jgi:hypothetical protein
MSYQEKKPVDFDFNVLRAQSTVGGERNGPAFLGLHQRQKLYSYQKKSRIQRITAMHNSQ